MPPPSLLSLLPAASVSPRSRRAARRRPPTASRLPVRGARAASPLHASSSSSSGGGEGGGGDELHLLEKPFPSPSPADEDESESTEAAPALSTEEALAPFLKFFQGKSTEPDEDDAAAGGGGGGGGGYVEEDEEDKGEGSAGAGAGGRGVVYYDPKPGDLAVGVVVGGDGRTLDIDVGAGGEPALMLAKEAVPMTGEEFEYLACDVASKDAAQFAAEGKVGVVVSGGEGQGEATGGRNGKGRGRGSPALGVGTVVFTEVLGRTLGGRPLLSARRLFRRVAWHRVRQIKQLNVPIKVKIFEWNAGGLLTRIEGLRAFLPKPEMMTRPRNFTDLKNTVGQQIHVCITRIDEKANELIISEKEAWAMTYLREGTLLQGTVRKLFPYGAQITIGDTNRGGLLHVSNITRGQLTSVGDVLKVGEEVKAIVIKSTAPGRIALSTKDLESEPGLFLSNKEKVFSEAEEMAQRCRDQISEKHQPAELDSSFDEVAPFDDEAVSYANWKWLRFSKSDKTNFNPRAESSL
ncbi:protein PIGMENT DEFECTIVE 338, chloroplastic-like [Oryza glaberrima]|uniref:S1 motif domain-containing protein n=1 Tax=Oryza barthii TaxID=65489 RepID=A0A0D3GA73_9ORYZ|nr:protein PIGMENT DEFECTIVE 338, chloroplastic-like [Oryza glaberrima]